MGSGTVMSLSKSLVHTEGVKVSRKCVEGIHGEKCSMRTAEASGQHSQHMPILVVTWLHLFELNLESQIVLYEWFTRLLSQESGKIKDVFSSSGCDIDLYRWNSALIQRDAWRLWLLLYM